MVQPKQQLTLLRYNKTMASKKDISYRELNDELDQILSELQAGDLDIDEAVKQYERGMQILEELETYLKTAENKVKKIKSDFEKP